MKAFFTAENAETAEKRNWFLHLRALGVLGGKQEEPWQRL